MNTQLSDILEQFISQSLQGIHTAIPGVIQEYSAAEKKAAVKPMLQSRYGETNFPYPIVTGVPVIFPGSSEAQISFPLKKGDGCLLICSERSLDEYMDTGRAEVPADPRIFSLTDAVCIPGLFSFSSPGVPGAEEGLEIIYKETSILIKDSGDVNISSSGLITIDGSSGVNLNGDAKTFVTHTELSTALQTFMNALNLHTHPTAATGPPSPPTVPLSLDISGAATTTVKTGG